MQWVVFTRRQRRKQNAGRQYATSADTGYAPRRPANYAQRKSLLPGSV